MMRAYIYTGGAVFTDRIYEHPKEEDLIIAADSGWHNAQRLGVKPQVLLGDFDSIGTGELPDVVEILQVPAEKDQTDTQLAVDLALSRGARDIVIIGGLSGRLDHSLSNLAILEELAERGVHALITDGYNRARFIRNTGTLIPRSGFRYLSLLLVEEKAKGVTVEGCKYPLKNATLQRRRQYAVSNEITGNCALVEVRRGALYVIEAAE
ncbi:MAG: thiamine diphosphokinase [Ruminococcaceae bacterium]|nr:thiamine diphosphokinase [Oscillospiraceae bacterium]